MKILCRARFNEDGMVDKFSNFKFQDGYGANDFNEEGIYDRCSHNGWIQTGYTLDIGKDDFTAAMWVRVTPETYNTEESLLFILGINYYYTIRLYSFYKSNNTGNSMILIMNESNSSHNDWTRVNTHKSVTDNKWHHIKLTRKNGMFKLFFDGQLVAILSRPSFNFSGKMQFGAGNGGNNSGHYYFDDVVLIRGAALEDTKYLFDFPEVYIADNVAYGVSHGIFQKLAGNWNYLSDLDKKNIFAEVNGKATLAQLETIKKFKISIYTKSDDQSVCKADAVSVDKIVFPRRLISLESLDRIDKVTIASTISPNAKCKLLVTTDLATFQTYDFQSQQWKVVDHTNLIEVENQGIDASQLSNIPRTAWDAFTKGKAGIGFAYLLSMEDTTDTCSIDKLELLVEMKGEWNKADIQ